MLLGIIMKKLAHLISFIALQMLMASGADAGPPANPGMLFTLLCKASVNGQLFTKNLEINYQDNKVDGIRAVITDTMITWNSRDFDQYRKTNVVTRHELNRLAGNYRYWQDGAIYSSPPPSYACEKAPQPKF